jgi:hypothetical protein
MTTPTNTPVPSGSPLDLLFNAEKLDEVVNSGALQYIDRFGVPRKTAAGAIASIAVVNPRGAWATGTVYAPRDLVTNSGTWYISLTNHTAGATFAGDEAANWRPHQGVIASDLASAVSALLGAGMVGYDPDLAYAIGTIGAKLNLWVDVREYGADPTGVSLSNAAFTAAKAKCNTFFLGPKIDGTPGIYRLEGWTAQDVRFIGQRASGANTGANEQTVIEGSGDLLTGANNFSMEHVVIRNSSAGTRGKLITCANIDTKIGPFIDVEFRKATHHVFQNDSTKALVDVQYVRCRFSDASVYSRYYEGGLFSYAEDDCYTQANKRGVYIRSCSTARLSGVMEFQEEGAIYVENTTASSDVIRALKFQNIHFEQNGDTTPTADVTVNVTLSRGQIDFDNCGFYSSTVAKPVNLSSSPTLRVVENNCPGIDFDNVAAGTVLTRINPKITGETSGLVIDGGDIRTSKALVSREGVQARDSLSVTITGSATPTPIAMPGAGKARLVLVVDSTTAGVALLMLHGTGTIVSVNSTLSSVTWSAVAGVLNGNTTGGASSRVMFFNYLAT